MRPGEIHSSPAVFVTGGVVGVHPGFLRRRQVVMGLGTGTVMWQTHAHVHVNVYGQPGSTASPTFPV